MSKESEGCETRNLCKNMPNLYNNFYELINFLNPSFMVANSMGTLIEIRDYIHYRNSSLWKMDHREARDGLKVKNLSVSWHYSGKTSISLSTATTCCLRKLLLLFPVCCVLGSFRTWLSLLGYLNFRWEIQAVLGDMVLYHGWWWWLSDLKSTPMRFSESEITCSNSLYHITRSTCTC